MLVLETTTKKTPPVALVSKNICCETLHLLSLQCTYLDLIEDSAVEGVLAVVTISDVVGVEEAIGFIYSTEQTFFQI